MHPDSMNFSRLKFLLLSLISLIQLPAIAQPANEMAFDLRQSGKIYVVVAVLMIIFIGIVVYLISLDKKISKLEAQQKESKK
jgi:CcmD family protein